ncbi:hypothetical protein JOF56_006916 [Kibdelosporangium banguiense]|uniref:VWFA domain-containing protein n=1 Tax=Kibdelosporangium banguiense TaxID=1365924 RepID=A0ABS4TRM7_9PSEU|nr:choice-of-anchor X domain-containing protein [Kibdelosporangium banguiense]MBP2326531.1 hypothetical protein [Kibdelosporangium banguiense]
MPPTIAPNALGFSSYTVSDSANAWFYLDIDLDAGTTAELELHCPVAATVTLTEGAGAPISLSTTGMIPTNNNGTRTVDSAGAAGAGGSVVLVTITATNPFHTTWQLRVSGVVPPATALLQINAGTAEITRVLADPVVTTPALSPLLEKSPITLTGTANYTTVPVGVGPAGTPAPPPLRARWEQVPSTISAPPPSTLFSATVATAPLNATIAPSPAFIAPGVYGPLNIDYRLTAFYDDNANMLADGAEPVASCVVTLPVKPRNQHMLLVLDRSGSMLATMPGTSKTRWDFAVEAAHVWADLWIGLRGGITGTTDKAGIMVFEANVCGWKNKTAAPIEILVPKSGNLGGVTDLDVQTLDLGMPGGCTPIGDSLVTAIDKFAALGGTVDDRYVILHMTDGFENSGAVVIEDDSPVPPGATSNFTAARVSTPARTTVNNTLAIYTVGLGPKASVQDSALVDLNENGEHRGLYKPIQANELMSTFGQMFGHALEAQDLTPPNPNDPFPVSAGEHRLAIALLRPSTNRMKVYRSVGGGPELQVAGPGAALGTGITTEDRGGHSIVMVDLEAHLGSPVPASTWRVEEYLADGTTRVPIGAGRLLALVDLFLTANIRFDRDRYATGQRALLTCQIAAGGAPVPRSQVRVELARPGEGLGSFLSANGSGYKPGNQSGPDPLAPKAAMLNALLQRKDRHELPVETPKGFFRDGTDELWDDGRHRDGVPDDGTYTNTYDKLDKEGLYTWRFTITGQTPDGNPFLRVATRTLWVSVGVDPAASKVEQKPVEVRGERQAVAITVTPMDSRGERLGPFRASEVKFTTDQGRFVPFTPTPSDGVVYPQQEKGELLSHYDGRYTQILTYDPRVRTTVTITVQGRKLPVITIP